MTEGETPQEKMYYSRNPFTRWVHNLPIKKVLSLLSPNGNILLDVGCGDGYFLKQVDVRCKVGLDTSLVPLRRAKRIAPDANLVRGDAHQLPFKHFCFDRVLCCDTLEHLTYPALTVGEMIRVSKQEGEVIVSAPNEKAWTLGRLLLFQRPLVKEIHKHDLSSSDLEKMFKRRYMDERKIPFDGFPLPLWNALKFKSQRS